ncbi:MAG: hypothetical protein WBR29_10770 [Gammaproteobacteria bacterium]
MIEKFLHDLFYSTDNELDLSRVLMFMGCVAFMAQGALAVVWKGQVFDAQAYGFGFAAIMAGGGFGVKRYNEAP